MKLDKIIAVRTGKTVYKDGGRVIKVFENGYSKADKVYEEKMGKFGGAGGMGGLL